MPAKERDEVMKLSMPGEKEGRWQEAAIIVQRLLHRRFGAPAEGRRSRIELLELEQLEQLVDDLHDFSSLADLDRWLGGRA